MIRIDNPADLAETLGLLRRLTGLTQSAVGDELGTNASRIGDYERGRFTPNGSTLMRHLAALGYQLAIVPAIETGPETAPIASVANRGAESHTRLGVSDSSGAEARSGGCEWNWKRTANGWYSGPDEIQEA